MSAIQSVPIHHRYTAGTKPSNIQHPCAPGRFYAICPYTTGGMPCKPENALLKSRRPIHPTRRTNFPGRGGRSALILLPPIRKHHPTRMPQTPPLRTRTHIPLPTPTPQHLTHNILPLRPPQNTLPRHRPRDAPPIPTTTRVLPPNQPLRRHKRVLLARRPHLLLVGSSLLRMIRRPRRQGLGRRVRAVAVTREGHGARNGGRGAGRAGQAREAGAAAFGFGG